LASLKYERRHFPNASQDSLESRARCHYEAAAREFLTQTLAIADSLRPNAKWGYYGYPHPGRIREPSSVPEVRTANNRLKWLYEASEVIYPSIYITKKSVFNSPGNGGDFIESNCTYIGLTLQESFRIVGKKPVVPFTWHEYHNTNPVYSEKIIKGYDVELQYIYPAAYPIDALILYESGSPRDSSFTQFMRDRLGPSITYVRNTRNLNITDPKWYLPLPCHSLDSLH
jgi:hypothetical protein